MGVLNIQACPTYVKADFELDVWQLLAPAYLSEPVILYGMDVLKLTFILGVFFATTLNVDIRYRDRYESFTAIYCNEVPKVRTFQI